jgi:hypothetical protein
MFFEDTAKRFEEDVLDVGAQKRVAVQDHFDDPFFRRFFGVTFRKNEVALAGGKIVRVDVRELHADVVDETVGELVLSHRVRDYGGVATDFLRKTSFVLATQSLDQLVNYPCDKHSVTSALVMFYRV